MGIDDESSHPEVCSEVAGGVTRNIVCLFREPDDGEPWHFTRDGFREACVAMRDTRLPLSGAYLGVANCGTRKAVDRSRASASKASLWRGHDADGGFISPLIPGT
jgi:hypothetical protein